jgi:hypothetical protein
LFPILVILKKKYICIIIFSLRKLILFYSKFTSCWPHIWSYFLSNTPKNFFVF